MTTTQWIGLVTFFFFAGMLVFSLWKGHKTPPPNDR